MKERIILRYLLKKGTEKLKSKRVFDTIEAMNRYVDCLREEAAQVGAELIIL